MPRWLYLWPLNFVIVGFVVFGAIFLLMAKRSRDKTRKADPRSIIAIFIQALAFAIAWTIGTQTVHALFADRLARAILRRCDHRCARTRVSDFRDRSRAHAWQTMEPASARPRASRTDTARPVSYRSPSDLHRHVRNARSPPAWPTGIGSASSSHLSSTISAR